MAKSQISAAIIAVLYYKVFISRAKRNISKPAVKRRDNMIACFISICTPISNIIINMNIPGKLGQ